MSNVGLLYSAAALIINGLVLLGVVSGRAAAPFNLLVGSMQVIFPTVALIQAAGDADAILSASSVYLFGFTYLYVGLNALTGASGEGLGWFSLFVTTCAVVFSLLEFLSGGFVYAVLWLFWGALWFLFFLMLAIQTKGIDRFSGWFTLLLGIFTVGVPGFLELAGGLPDTPLTGSIALGVGLVLLLASWLLGRAKRPDDAAHPAAV